MPDDVFSQIHTEAQKPGNDVFSQIHNESQSAAPANDSHGLTDSYNPNVEEWASKHPIAGPIVRGLDAAGGAVMGAPAGIASMVMHPVDTAKGIGQSLAAWKDPNTWKGAASVLPEALGQGIGNVAVGEVTPSIPGAVSAAKDATGTALRTIDGTLKPGVKTAAQAGGLLVGHSTGIPGAGELGGYLMGPKLADLLIPKRPIDPVYPGASLPAASDFYANKGAEINAAMKQQPDAFKPPPAPSYPGASLPSADEFYANEGAERMKIKRMQDIQASRDALFAKRNPNSGVPLSDLARAQMPAEPSRIVTPDSPAPPINKTLVSYPRSTLVDMANKGNLDALRELIRNPGGIDISKAVPNSKYLLEANRPTRIYGGPSE